MEIWSNVNFYVLWGFEEYINLILEEVGKVNIKRESKKLQVGSFSHFTLLFPKCAYSKCGTSILLFVNYISKNVQGRVFLRDATQQPPLSLSLSLSLNSGNNDFRNCVNWQYVAFSIPLRSSIFVYWQCQNLDTSSTSRTINVIYERYLIE